MWTTLGERFRVLRRRLGLRQIDVAAMTGLSRQMISRLERGECDRMLFAVADKVAAALGARLVVYLSWQGEQLDRLVDAGHAELQNAVVNLLTAAGWLCAVEVSFNHYGDRGRYDVLAYHRASGIVLVIEVKTAIGDVQAALGQLDVKGRLALGIARDRGWQARHVVTMLVIADERQQHRIVARHAALFAAFALRGHSARSWLRRPSAGSANLLIYLPLTDVRTLNARRSQRGARIRSGNPTDAHATGVTSVPAVARAATASKSAD
ncbi:MAG: helix-turn-helix domain-containing protein [Chloroflexota bacterium]